VLSAAPEFRKSKFYTKTKQFRDPSFQMITDAQFEQVEKEAYASFKALMPRLVEEAIEAAVKHQ
jgi:hypothetical protein